MTSPEIPKLETERLILRPFEISDAEEVQRLAGDWSVADTTLNIPHPYADGMAEAWISTHAEAFIAGHGLTLAIAKKSGGALIGAVSLLGISRGHQAELGYWIGRPCWNEGFCTEAGQAVLLYAFGALGLARVHSCHLTRNPASGQVLRKLGMQHEGTRRRHVRKWDTFEDLELYGILRPDEVS